MARKRNGMKTWKKLLIALGILLFIVIVGVITLSVMVVPNDIVYEHTKIPKTFVDFKVAHISDLYNNKTNVLKTVKSGRPDLILITGNLSDKNGNFKKSVALLNQLNKIAPTYYVLGEYDESNRERILESVEAECIEGEIVKIPAPKVNTEKFIERYVGKKHIKAARNGDEESIEYLKYVEETLRESKDAYIEISGLPCMDDTTDFIEKAYEVLDKDKKIFQILMMNQSQYSRNVAKTDVQVILTGNFLKNSVTESAMPRGLVDTDGTSIFVSSGIGSDNRIRPRLLDMSEVSIIRLSDGTIDMKNPMEKLLDSLFGESDDLFIRDTGFVKYIQKFVDTAKDGIS